MIHPFLILFLVFRSKVLNALQSPIKEAGNTSAQIVAAIGAVELPKKQWDDLLKVLLHNVTNGPSDLVRVNTLQVIIGTQNFRICL